MNKKDKEKLKATVKDIKRSKGLIALTIQDKGINLAYNIGDVKTGEFMALQNALAEVNMCLWRSYHKTREADMKKAKKAFDKKVKKNGRKMVSTSI